MNKLVAHLQKYLDGEVLAEPTILEYFAIDGSIFRIPPRVVVYPRNQSDVRKAVRFSWQLAEKGQRLPITARGKGTDQGGAAIGSGMILAMPAHMNRLLGFDKTDVVVQPGLLFGDLERTLHSHARFLPPYPASAEFSTVGGAVANNACGEKSLKYGCTRDYVKSLDVVLANGQLIRAQKLNAKALSKKKGQTDFEGEIYRSLDGLLDDHAKLIANAKARFAKLKNAAGYDLWDIKGKDGSFDLSKLLVGSQGTLGIVTAVTFTTEAYNQHTKLVAAFFADIEKANEAVEKLRKLGPSALELVDGYLFRYMSQHQPQRLEGLIEGELPKIMLLVEFDDAKTRNRDHKVKKAQKLLQGLATNHLVASSEKDQDRLWQLRRSAAAVMSQNQAKKRAVPAIEDGVIGPDQLPEFLAAVYKLFADHGLEAAVWGHAGEGNFHLQPFLDLASVGDRQLLFKLMDEFYPLVLSLGGSISGEHSDGRLRAPYLEAMYGEEVYQLFHQVKRIFDPHNILNPGVKLDFAKEDMVPILRHEYSMPHLFDHMPHVS